MVYALACDILGVGVRLGLEMLFFPLIPKPCRWGNVPKYNSLAEVKFNVYLILICSELARISCGWHLKLDQFASIVDFLTAICYREQSLEQLQAFEEEVKGRSEGKYIIL